MGQTYYLQSVHKEYPWTVVCGTEFKPHTNKWKGAGESSNVAVKLITGIKNSYEENLQELKLPTLKERQNIQSLNFAIFLSN